VPDAIAWVPEDTSLEHRLGISGAVGAFGVGKVLVSDACVAAAGPATTRNRAQEVRAGRAIAESSSSGWRTEPLDVVDQIACARVVPGNLRYVGLGRPKVGVVGRVPVRALRSSAVQRGVQILEISAADRNRVLALTKAGDADAGKGDTVSIVKQARAG